MHAVRAYSADPARSAPVFGEVLGMETEGDGRWLAWGERRHGLVLYDAAPVESGMLGAGTVHHSRSPSVTVSSMRGGPRSPPPGFGRRPFWIARCSSPFTSESPAAFCWRSPPISRGSRSSPGSANRSC